MVITLIAPSTVSTTAVAVDVRCLCGGYLVYAPSGALSHVDTCAELHPVDVECPDAGYTHRTCPTPRPVPCSHAHRQPTPSSINTVCWADLDACCGCCQGDR